MPCIRDWLNCQHMHIVKYYTVIKEGGIPSGTLKSGTLN